MKTNRWCKLLAVATACMHVCVGGVARASQPNLTGNVMATSPAATATDVALTNRRSLDGQVVNANGAPVAHSTVWALQGGKSVATAQTDEQGWFSFDSMKGGVYQLETENGAGLVRAWTESSAPPVAQSHALLVADGQVARGQGAMRRLITNPWVWGIGIATAIAVPVIIAASDDDDKKKGS